MKPLVLIVNDDGILSPGLAAMAYAVKDLGELVIAAPNVQQTTMGRAFPRPDNVGVIKKINIPYKDIMLSGYSIVGSPAYAVSHGVLEIAERKPDLCLSGVNYGENLGTSVTCSGTIGAVLEADTYKIPGIAFSLAADIGVQRSSEYQKKNWDKVEKIVRYWAQKCLVQGMPYGASMLNINIPELQPEPEQYCYTRQSSQSYFEFCEPEQRDWNRPYEIPTAVHYDEHTLEEDSDIYTVCVKQMISVTPMVHDLTARGFN